MLTVDAWLETWASEHPDDPDVEDVFERVRRDQEAYLHWGKSNVRHTPVVFTPHGESNLRHKVSNMNDRQTHLQMV